MKEEIENELNKFLHDNKRSKRKKIVEYLSVLSAIVIILLLSVHLFLIQQRMISSITEVSYTQTKLILSNILRDRENHDYNKLVKQLQFLKTEDVVRMFVLLKKDNLFYEIRNVNLENQSEEIPVIFNPSDKELNVIRRSLIKDSIIVKYHQNIENVGFSLYYPTYVIYNNNLYRCEIVIDYKLNSISDVTSQIVDTKIVLMFITLISILLTIITIGFTIKDINMYDNKMNISNNLENSDEKK